MSLQGSATVEQRTHLRELAAPMAHVAEIGFNEGVSATALLSANPAIRVVSFELADHFDMHWAKMRIDFAYPGQHQLIQGDSKVTVPAWDGDPFDLMYVDGDHAYEAVKADLAAAVRVVRPGGLIVIDDLTPWKPWGAGPVMAWRELLAAGQVRQADLRIDGVAAREIPQDGPDGMRVWATGILIT